MENFHMFMAIGLLNSHIVKSKPPINETFDSTWLSQNYVVVNAIANWGSMSY
jgi:hypothetical protein